MMKSIRLFGLLAIIMLLAIGCSNDPAPVGPMNGAVTSQISFVLPSGAELNSAMFYVAVREASGQNVNVHRVTSPWEEMTVTWNNFGNAYAPDVYGSFTAGATVYYGVDITAMVSEWVNGTYPNYGLLMDQNDMYYPWTIYYAREVSWSPPYLELLYTVDGEEIHEMIYPVGDAFIWGGLPDNNFGSENVLYTGAPNEGSMLKRALVQFDVSTTFEDGCSLTIGYWKTHAGFGPQADDVTPLLPIWLGTAGGAKSLEVTTAAMAVDVLVMKTYGKNSNGITKLYAQLLGAKLNLASGAGGEAIDDVIAAADAFLADHNWLDWAGLSDSESSDVMYWQGMLDDYNNGLIGPGHCIE